MATIVLHDKYTGKVVFDNETGEIFHFEKFRGKKVPSIQKYVGIDVKYPSECITRESLLESISVIDYYLSNAPTINYPHIVESMQKVDLSKRESELLIYIGKNLSAWNTYIGSTEDLTESGIGSNHISGMLLQLQRKHALEIIARHKPQRGNIVLRINPMFAWKGDNEFRNDAKTRWYSGNRIMKRQNS